MQSGGLPAAINKALARCQKASGGRRLRLPQDFQLYPVFKVNADGSKCLGVDFWLARLGTHIGRGSTPEWAVGALCPNRNGGSQ